MPIICEPRDSGLNKTAAFPGGTAIRRRHLLRVKLMPWLRMRSEKHSSGKANDVDSADVQVRNLEVVDVDFCCARCILPSRATMLLCFLLKLPPRIC